MSSKGERKGHSAHSYLRIRESWEERGHGGTFSKLNPTAARFHDPKLDTDLEWSARAHRKGRFPRITDTKHEVHSPHVRLWGWEPWNISWLVAMFFLVGSVFWCINGWQSFLPFGSSRFQYDFIGWTAFAGGTCFEFGSILLYIESLNVSKDAQFGHEVEQMVEEGMLHLHPRDRGYRSRNWVVEMLPLHKHGNSKPSNGANGAAKTASNASSSQDSHAGEDHTDAGAPKDKWVWVGFRPRDIGFWASFVQLIAATLFEVSVIVGVPGLLSAESDSNYGWWDAFYWAMQVAGSTGFIISSILFMLETQPSWWKIQPQKLGWHVGAWNLLGSFGFFFSGLFGLWADPSGRYQKWGTYFSTFWGSWAFLISSYCQLLEQLNPHPLAAPQAAKQIAKGKFKLW